GVGKRKLEEYGPKFLAVIARHLEDYAPLTIPKEPNPPPAIFLRGKNRTSNQKGFENQHDLEDYEKTASSKRPSRKRPLGETVHETLRCFRSGYSIEQIAKERGLVTSTIYGHLEQAIQAGEPVDLTQLWTPEQELEMTAAFEKTGFGNLTGAKELLGNLYDFGQLRLFRAVHGKKG
nr:helix-turn-helix domain-containing protein [Nitrospirales bacterium]